MVSGDGTVSVLFPYLCSIFAIDGVKRHSMKLISSSSDSTAKLNRPRIPKKASLYEFDKPPSISSSERRVCSHSEDSVLTFLDLVVSTPPWR